MTEMYEKYVKYKMKYLNLVNNIDYVGGVSPIKRNYSQRTEPDITDLKKPSNIKELSIISPQKKTSVSFSQEITTPTKKMYLYTKIPDKIHKTEIPIITPSKDVNKNNLIDILNSFDIKMICTNRDFDCIFKDKRKTGDGCVLELWTRPLLGDKYYNVGHITVHKGVSRNAAKSFHYKSDDFSNDGVNFNLVITASQNMDGKYLLFGQNSISRTTNKFSELIWIYHRLGFKDLGNRIQEVVIDIISFLNTFPDEIFYDPS